MPGLKNRILLTSNCLSLGTVTDGLRRLVPLFEPLYEGLVEHQRQEHHWQADETRWLVFATLEGKVGHRWYLWAVQSEQTVVLLLDPSRSHDVPERLLGSQAFGILNVDRYVADGRALEPQSASVADRLPGVVRCRRGSATGEGRAFPAVADE